jgi:hypothetical protein
MNLISGKGETSSRLPGPFSLFLPGSCPNNRNRCRFLVGVAIYLRRVLHDSGFCNNFEPNRLQQLPGTADRSDVREAAQDIWTHSICTGLYTRPPSGSGYYKASMVAQEFVPKEARSPIENEAASARSSWIAAMRGSFGVYYYKTRKFDPVQMMDPGE